MPSRKVHGARREKFKKKRPNGKYYPLGEIETLAEQANQFKQLMSYYYIDSKNIKDLFKFPYQEESDDNLGFKEKIDFYNDLDQIMQQVLRYILSDSEDQLPFEEQEHAKKRLKKVKLFQKHCILRF